MYLLRHITLRLMPPEQSYNILDYIILTQILL